MSKQPYYKAYLDADNRDITEYVESIIYDDTTEKDSMMTLNMYDSVSLELADDPEFVSGAVVRVHFGFINGDISEVHVCRITDISHVYTEKVTMTVRCLDIGTTLKKARSTKIWKGVTSSEIAKSIADKYSLDLETDTTSKVWEHLPQGNKSDFEFLEYIAMREDSGNYVVFIRNSTLYFVKRAVDKNSTLTFEYGFGNGTIISFSPALKESGDSGQTQKSSIVNIDSETGDVTTVDTDASTEESTGTTGKYKLLYGGENGEQVGREFVGKNIDNPTEDVAEAKNLNNNAVKNSRLNKLMGTLRIEGEPLISPNTIITLTNFASMHNGNWYVLGIKHTLSQSDYESHLTISKNGTNSTKLNNSETDDANTSVGDKEASDVVKVRTFSGEDGSFQGYSSSDTTVKKSK